MSIKLTNNCKIQPVILAPMSGITDLPFRNIVRKCGAGLLLSEMVVCRSMLMNATKTLMRSEIGDNETGIQLAGCEPSLMAEAAKISQDKGINILDINFGCPMKKVTGGYAGSYLMKDVELASKILKSVVDSVSIPVTLKMRMGWDHDNLNAPEIAKIAEDLGIKMITVHGRTRSQLYSGKANWKFINKVKKSVNIPVIVNGDIDSFESIKTALSESEADGVMIGRAACGRPWLIHEAINYLKNENSSELSHHQKTQLILEHLTNALDYYGITRGVKIMRKHLGWYSSKLPNSSTFRQNICQITDSTEIISLTQEFFQNTKVPI